MGPEPALRAIPFAAPLRAESEIRDAILARVPSARDSNV